METKHAEKISYKKYDNNSCSVVIQCRGSDNISFTIHFHTLVNIITRTKQIIKIIQSSDGILDLIQKNSETPLFSGFIESEKLDFEVVYDWLEEKVYWHIRLFGILPEPDKESRLTNEHKVEIYNKKTNNQFILSNPV